MSVYLDWAATAPVDPSAIAEMNGALGDAWGNPSSRHEYGKRAAELLSSARARCAGALGVPPECVVFTSGGTESDHLPLLSLLQRPVRGTVAFSSVEHPAITEQARSLETTGWKALSIPVTREGFVTPEAVLSSIREDTAFVAVMAVNNETGAIQPVREISEALTAACKGRKRPHFHVDAVQAAGKIPLPFPFPGIDSAAISAHKIGGPRGIGLLYLARRIEPFIRGGGQEGGIRPGTENVAGALALARCLESCDSHAPSLAENGALLHELLSGIPGIGIIPRTRTPRDQRFSPCIYQCTNERLPGEVLVRILSDSGFCVSTGSACSSKKKGRPVLQAMGVSPAEQQNAFRISTGSATTRDELEAFASALSGIIARS